jgi:hypothetical protein
LLLASTSLAVRWQASGGRSWSANCAPLSMPLLLNCWCSQGGLMILLDHYSAACARALPDEPLRGCIRLGNNTHERVCALDARRQTRHSHKRKDSLLPILRGLESMQRGAPAVRMRSCRTAVLGIGGVHLQHMSTSERDP